MVAQCACILVSLNNSDLRSFMGYSQVFVLIIDLMTACVSDAATVFASFEAIILFCTAFIICVSPLSESVHVTMGILMICHSLSDKTSPVHIPITATLYSAPICSVCNFLKPSLTTPAVFGFLQPNFLWMLEEKSVWERGPVLLIVSIQLCLKATESISGLD